jgi:hypothetical protein
MELAITERDTAVLTQLMAGVAWEDARLDRHIPRLFDFARTLIGDPSTISLGGTIMAELLRATNSESFDWASYRALLDETTDPKVLTQLVNAMGVQVDPASVSDRLDYLYQFVAVRPDTTAPIRTGERAHEVPDSLVKTSAEAMLRILAIQAPAIHASWPVIRTLALYEPGASAMRVIGTDFLAVCNFWQRLAETSPIAAATCIVDFMERIAGAPFIGLGPSLWENELAAAIRGAFTNGIGSTGARLIRLCARLDPDLAPAILAPIAERHYTEARSVVYELARTDLDPDLHAYVNELIRDHDRGFGTRALPEVLALLR